MAEELSRLDDDEKLIVQAIIKEVHGNDVALSEVITFEPHHINVDGEIISTVLIKTNDKLYTLKREYFQKLFQKYTKIALSAVKNAVQQEAEAVRQKADSEASAPSTPQEVRVDSSSNTKKREIPTTPQLDKNEPLCCELTHLPQCKVSKKVGKTKKFMAKIQQGIERVREVLQHNKFKIHQWGKPANKIWEKLTKALDAMLVKPRVWIAFRRCLQ